MVELSKEEWKKGFVVPS